MSKEGLGSESRVRVRVRVPGPTGAKDPTVILLFCQPRDLNHSHTGMDKDPQLTE